MVNDYHPKASSEEKDLLMEFVLHGLAEYSLLSKQGLKSGLQFKDLLSGMLNIDDFGKDDEDDDDEDKEDEEDKKDDDEK